MSAPDLPTGTVTFLFTDVEGSTRLAERLGAEYPDALREQERIVGAAVDAAGGRIFGTEGDAVFAAFHSPTAAVQAAVAVQREIVARPWPGDEPLLVRIGIHTGEAMHVDGNYVGLELNRVARISAAAHGGQIVVSEATLALVADHLPDEISLRPLGEFRLKDLTRPERISQVVAPGLDADFPPLRTLDATPNNLPVQLTTFVGREREVAMARRLLGDTRLLTLTGPGGTGKTRLSLQVAAEASDAFPDGVYFVALESITDPGLLPSAIEGALNLVDKSPRPPLERLVDHLADKRVLLVLDNFEQLVEGGPIVAELLRGTRHVKLVVTSRTALRISGEQESPVPPLRLPEPTAAADVTTLAQYEAVQLFVERARAVEPEFDVTDDNAAAVAEIVARLDGMPLAIELAAARVRLFSPEEIIVRLRDLLGFLAGGPRDLPDRQQTLRGAIRWSYDLLTAAERHLFDRLSVFMGGCRLADAEAVCGPASELGGLEVFDGLQSLVEKSLLRPSTIDRERRFTMLDTIRAFAAERLAERGEPAAVRDRHAALFLELVETAMPKLRGPDQRTWLDRLNRDHDNVRAALGTFVETGDATRAHRLVGAAWRFWQMRGYLFEGRERAGRVLAMPGAEPVARLRGLEGAGGMAYWQNDTMAANAAYSEALEIARGLGDDREIANALYDLSFAPAAVEHLDFGTLSSDPELRKQVLGYAQESLAIYERLGDEQGLTNALWGLGTFLLFIREYDEASRAIERSLELARGRDDRFSEGWGLHQLQFIRLGQGRIEEVRPMLDSAMSIFRAGGDLSGVVWILSDYAALAVHEGDLPRAHRLAGAVEAITASAGTTLTESVSSIPDVGPPPPSDDPELKSAREAGTRMSTEEAVVYAVGAVAHPASVAGPPGGG